MTYCFLCHNCGEYAVGQRTFEAFLTEALRTKLHRRRDALQAVLSFGNAGSCPRCSPDKRVYEVVLKIRK